MHLLFVRIAGQGEWLPGQDRFDPEQSPAGKAPIYLRITLGGRSSIATGVYATAEEWDVESHRLIGKSNEVKLANKKLTDLESDATEKYLLLKPKNPTCRQIKKALKGTEAGTTLTLTSLYEDFYAYQSQPEKELALKTREGYAGCLSKLRAYLLTIKQKNVLAREINLQWMRRYETYLLQVRKLKVPSMKKHMTVLMLVFKHGAHTGQLETNPILGYKSEARQRAKVPAFLTREELNLLRSAHYPHRRQREVVDVFLFLCYTGLSNVDYLRFDPTKHLATYKGYEFIRMQRQKSGVQFSAWFQPQAKAILDKYLGKLPEFNNDAFNDTLDRVAKRVGIQKNITTGLARHTYSQHLRDAGFSDESTKHQTGHTVEAMNRHYSKISEDRIIQEMQALQLHQPPTLVDQLRAALQDPTQAAQLRALLGG